jgi:hypothetical protein
VLENFFSFFGAAPSPGRGFTSDEIALNGPSAVIVSHRLWQTRFGGRPEACGRGRTRPTT